MLFWRMRRKWRLSSFNKWWMLARVITGTHKFDRGLLRLLHTELHWLNVPERVTYKLCIMVHSCLARSSTSVLGRPLPTSLRRRFSAASQVRQLTTPGSSASLVANVRLNLCCWPVGLELIAWHFERSECHQRQLPQTFENTFVRSVLKHPAH